jgi:glyoxylase-like metal-dependent hydrolase (beta-lactamase superfamily II)
VSAGTETDARSAWAEPGAFPVAPGVHRIPLPLPLDGLRAVNVYSVEDGDALVLIDSGWAVAESRSALTAGLAAIGAAPGDVRQVFVTHSHRDHYTQAIELRGLYGTKVSLGEGEQDSMKLYMSRDINPLRPQIAQLIACGAGPVIEAMRAEGTGERPGVGWEGPDEWLTGGQRIELSTRVLGVLPTPGHTMGHVVFTDQEAGLLFAGDHILPHITPSIGFEPSAPSQPLAHYLQSLHLVKTLPDLRLLPAHGPVTGSAHARIDELLAHHEQRLALSAEAVGSGAATAYEAATRLRWTRRERQLATLDSFNQLLAVVETRAHLEVLVTQGRLVKSWDGEVAIYRPAPPPASPAEPPGQPG